MGEKLTDVGQREETKSDSVSGKEIGLGIQVVIVDRDVKRVSTNPRTKLGSSEGSEGGTEQAKLC